MGPEHSGVVLPDLCTFLVIWNGYNTGWLMRNIEIIHTYSIDFITDDMTIKGADGELASQFSDQGSVGKSTSAIQSKLMVVVMFFSTVQCDSFKQ
jgi:hypothetical protein